MDRCRYNLRRTPWQQTRTALCAALLVPFGSGLSHAAKAPTARVTRLDRAFVIETPRLAATFRDGMIVDVRQRDPDERHADQAAADESAVPAGMGHLTGAPEAVSKLHMPWGTRTMNQEIKPGTAFLALHRPHAGSAYRVDDIRHGLRATWTGLSNGNQTFPDEALTVSAWMDADTGALLFQAVATSPQAGVYGVQVPVANLHADHRVYLPSFGGIVEDAKMTPGLTTLGGAPFWEAPVLALEGRTGTLGLWTEDAEFHPNFCFFNWTGRTFAVAIEHLNLMPFEGLKRTESVVWHLDAVKGGWVDAMTPYRDWYARTFAAELKTRAATAWANRIEVICDEFEAGSPASYRQFATVFDPETVLFHEWNARSPGFDHDLPDWTPRAGYPERVKAMQALGFRTMAYVNTYCVNVNSPVFVRDGIREFGLTRKQSVSDYTKTLPTFADAKDGQLLYLDPLSTRWRQYHTDMMIQWRKDTGTDANYEDTGGCVGDCGNGVVDGKSAGQGGAEQFRELLRRNPTVPMASEYAPNPIAFAVRWPLRYQQVWGSPATRVFWMSHQRPISAFIHGPHHRAWVPLINAESNLQRHVVAACADALGGVAQFPATRVALEANQGILVHLRWRAQLFSRRQLAPDFPAARQEPALACLYRDRDGHLYRYYADDQVQRLVGPDGNDLYARITGLNRYPTRLNLPGWPAIAAGNVVGLDPKVRYALVPGVPDPTGLAIDELPEGIRISRYYETSQFTVLNLEPVDDKSPKQGRVRLLPRAKFAQYLVSDRPPEPPPAPPADDTPAAIDATVAFPANVALFKSAAPAAAFDQYLGDGHETGRYILIESGLERGGEYQPPYRASFAVSGEKATVPFVFLNYGMDAEVVLDYVTRVPAKDATLRVYTVSRERRYGNATIGRLYVNGRLRHEYDFGPRPNKAWKQGDPETDKTVWDTSYHAWSVPLGDLAGQAVVVTVATDSKGSNNADNHWWSRPKFVRDAEQQASFVRIENDGPVPEE